MLKILIMGLPTSGKSTISKLLSDKLKSEGFTTKWLNADELRTLHNDWDFTEEGRIRQAKRMNLYSQLSELDSTDIVLFDFVAPLFRQRILVNPNYVVWVNTVQESPYLDTDNTFEQPTLVDLQVTEKNAEKYVNQIFNDLVTKGYLDARFKTQINHQGC